jgi:hypothetical protein
MTSFILFLAMLFGGASFLLFTADNMAGAGPGWASNMCSAAHLLCQNPQQLGIVAAGLAGLWLVMKFVSALRG